MQGGYHNASSGTIIYKKSFKDGNYTLVGATIPGNMSATYEHMNFGNQTNTGFYYTCYDSFAIKWAAFGYIS